MWESRVDTRYDMKTDISYFIVIKFAVIHISGVIRMLQIVLHGVCLLDWFIFTHWLCLSDDTSHEH